MAGRPTATRWPGARLKKAWPSCPARHFFAPTRTRPRCACRSPRWTSSRFAQAWPAWRRRSERMGPGLGPPEYLRLRLRCERLRAAGRLPLDYPPASAPPASRPPAPAPPAAALRARNSPSFCPILISKPPHPRRRFARAQLAQFLRNPDLQTALDRQVETGLGHVLGQIALARSKAILLI